MPSVKRSAFVCLLLIPFVVMAQDLPQDKLERGLRLQQEWKEQEAIRDAAEHEMKRIHRDALLLRVELCEMGFEDKCPPKTFKIKVTSYNAEVGQTDASPCSGAGGNVCDATKDGHRVIALSQDLARKHFKMGQTVYLHSDKPACSGKFLMIDVMNARWSMKGDLFFLSRKDNTSCDAIISDKPLNI